MRALLLALATASAILVAGAAQAVQPDEVLSNSALEARARAISAELRCLVCQNQSIDDSDADLARDLRLLVRERLLAGDTDEQVLEFIVARYGEFVLLRPALSVQNALLWGAPLIILGAGAAYLLIRRRRLSSNTTAMLSAEERERVAALLKTGE